jgi:hypothetical protein
MRMGSPQEDVIPAIFPDLSRYMSNGKKSCLPWRTIHIIDAKIVRLGVVPAGKILL